MEGKPMTFSSDTLVDLISVHKSAQDAGKKFFKNDPNGELSREFAEIFHGMVVLNPNYEKLQCAIREANTSQATIKARTAYQLYITQNTIKTMVEMIMNRERE